MSTVPASLAVCPAPDAAAALDVTGPHATRGR